MLKTVTVIPADKTIIVDGVGVKACFGVSANIHVIQWANGKGHIEYNDGRAHQYFANEGYERHVAPFVTIWRRIQKEPLPAIPLAEVKEAKWREIVQKANEGMNREYAFCEVATWPQQEAGARIIMSNEEGAVDAGVIVLLEHEGLRKRAVDLVRRLAQERGTAVEVFAAKVLENADDTVARQALVFTRHRALKAQFKQLCATGKIQALMSMPVLYDEETETDMV